MAAYILLTCTLCVAFAGATYLILKKVEDQLIDRRLWQIADRYIEHHRRGIAVETPPNVTLYQGQAMPAVLRSLNPGTYELPVDGVSQNILVRTDGGERFVLVDNDSEFERIRFDVYMSLAAVFATCLGLAVMLGRATASRVIAPVTALAAAVEQEYGMGELPSLESTDEIGVLARAFAARTAHLQEFLARERVFAGDVSHELRTPLTIILGAAELLESRLQARPELLQVTERIRRTAVGTTDRIAALLLLSRSPETVDAPEISLLPLIAREIERYEPLLDGKPVVLELKVSNEVNVFSRPELAGIAIGNLIRNACQFTERGHVRVLLDARQLVIEDTGPGIPLSIRERLFDRFVRASADSSTGSGLGLAIVRRVAAHLGWDVAYEDRRGGGSRFVVTFPARP